MFIREVKYTDKKSGNQYKSYRLAESVRTHKGVRQRILLSFGSGFSVAKEKWNGLASRIEEIATGQQVMFVLDKELEAIAMRYGRELAKKQKAICHPFKKEVTPSYHSVDLSSLTNSDITSIGGEHVAYETIKRLELDKKLKDLGFNGVQIASAVGIIIGRMLWPGSERRTHKHLQESSALGELIGYNFHNLSLDKVYNISDKLLANKDSLEDFLYSKEVSLFNFKEVIMLYDLTNTYFEGSGCFNDKAAFGRSKEKRKDCRLVTLGLVLNSAGFPRQTEILPGNISETKTLENVLQRLKHDSKSTIIMDAGIATEENLKYLSNAGYSYIVVSRKRNPIMPEGGECTIVKQEKNNTVKVKLIKNSETNENELYCHSTAKEKKENSMKATCAKHYEESLATLAAGLNKKGHVKKEDRVLVALGRLREKYKLVSGNYDVKVKSDAKKIAIELTWKRKREDNPSNGVYCLRTNTNLSEKELWKTYMTLTEVESVFRCLKSELGLRPVYHQKTTRVDGHLFISVLAYHIIHNIRYQLKQQKITNSWSYIRDTLSEQFCITTTIADSNGKAINVRQTSEPTCDQRFIYDALHLPYYPLKKSLSII